ncbi:hypothetical protein MKX03_007871 [Papaver bracteatum]|nr:hypothetical protein MKX03_007871 [Papaver bracteatum]
MDLQEYVENYHPDVDDWDDYDHSIVYGDGYDDYAGECFYLSTDDEEGEPNEGTVSILGDEKKKTDMSESGVEKELGFHHLSDGEETNMDIEDGALEENMATERKKRENRKSQEDGVESEQNSGIEIAIEVKKKKDSISKSDV